MAIQKIVVLIIFLAFPFRRSAGDTLMKGPHALVIGKGNMTGNRIDWTDCEGTRHKEYLKPPYWVDKNKNCEMSPSAFGIEWNGNEYVAVNLTELHKYLPGVSKGTRIFFTKVEHGVVLGVAGRTLELYSGLAGDYLDSPRFINQNELVAYDKTFHGCIASKGGEMVLLRKSGSETLLVGPDLSSHVGQEVTLQGTWIEKDKSAANSVTHDRFAVSSVDVISSTCKAQ